MSPIELPTTKPQRGFGSKQSHDYPNTTKGNPDQSPSPAQARITIVSIERRHVLSATSDTDASTGREQGNKPLSNCFYGGAFPHCLTGPTRDD
ncbi:hypothetical protein BO82DRAFT_352899 [Aspergillus uvarum CBS 121591]|uniref:Uncharacterized protein n=1 Tax=Aspergillus uvarum CBS 121591 TaxID=1448315 RepID=A0A319CCW3_9EURO|nr:hypothetical protein BO82DRAFT_352899 [Aspergillus uvarum CBS 121591]PYH83485.1 hypothetical protein BO82DRAFT_352899 [Aspergillus uvarum CBS 121591]